MCLGALVDAGVPLVYLQEQLARLGLGQAFHLHQQQVLKKGIQGTQVTVHVADNQPLRQLPEIETLIQQADLPHQATAWALAIFRCLAQAEGQVHALPPTQVHFHEVGAVDAIVDIVGTSLGLAWLGVEQIFCSPLPFGGGTVVAAHGRMPVPTPAVLKMWQQYHVPTYSNNLLYELVTPTGSAIVCALAQQFGAVPAMVVESVGQGAGERNLAIPNLLRIWIGETVSESAHEPSHHHHGLIHEHHSHEQVVAVLETQLDDLSPQVVAYLSEQLLAAGAWDVYCTAVTMKKSRTGLLMTVLCPPALRLTCEEWLFRETTTLGIRRHYLVRSVLGREFQTVETEFGTVALKIGERNGQIYTVQPEYEDCRQLAQKTHQPLKKIQQAALEAYAQRHR